MRTFQVIRNNLLLGLKTDPIPRSSQILLVAWENPGKVGEPTWLQLPFFPLTPLRSSLKFYFIIMLLYRQIVQCALPSQYRAPKVVDCKSHDLKLGQKELGKTEERQLVKPKVGSRLLNLSLYPREPCQMVGPEDKN